MRFSRIIVGLIVSCLFIVKTQAQRGYAKDSLQIKVYTEITYKKSQIKSLKVIRIFCDYCNEAQKKALKQEAWHRSYDERFSKANKLIDGVRKLALYIRISKKDFANMKSLDN